jgi:threonine dehydrogenase-like Zn-dependent dehydrogenase
LGRLVGGLGTLAERLEAAADYTGMVDEEVLATHKLPLDEAPHGYEIFQKKQDGAIKVLLEP